MKIAYISTSTIPSRTANSIHIMKMCQAFAKNGNKVVLIAPDIKTVEPSIGNVYDFYGVEESFEINKLKLMGIPGRGYLFGFCAAYNALRLKTDVVYSRNLEGCFFSTLFSLPTVFEVHQPLPTRKPSKFVFEQLIKSRHLKRIVSITNALKKQYSDNFSIDPERIIVAPDGADPVFSGIIPAQIEEAKGYRVTIGYIGHLYAGRGIELIVEMAKHCPWAYFLIIGGRNADVLRCKNMAKHIRNISFLGFLPPASTEKYRVACDILLAPYANKVITNAGADTTKWMSPMKLFEYMAAGKAIITSNLPALREVLTHRENAILCDPENVAEWVSALKLLSNDKVLRDKIAKNAHTDFITNYTWLSRAKQLLSKL